MQTKKYDFIDFLRGIAILLVFINHIPRYEDILFSDLNIYQQYFFLIGTYGVQLFYIVSAFTLLASLSAYNEVNYFNFFLRRIFRIVPIFFLGIFFYSFYLDHGPTDPMNVVLNLLFLNNIIPPSNDLIPGGSTISTEMNFYMIFPLMFILINNYKKTLISIFFIIFILFILNLFFEHFFYDKYFGEANFYRTIFTQIFVFLLGFLAFYINKDFLGEELNKKKIIKIVFYTLPIFIFIILIFALGRREQEFFYFRNLMIISIFLFLLFNFIFIFSKILRKNFVFKIVKNIGKVSFSMYVWHWVVLGHVWNHYFLKMENFNGKMILFIFSTLIATYFISFASYQVEKFFISIGKKITAK